MIGQKLKAIRTEKKIKQSDVATFLGCARTTYTQYETGASEPDIDTINKLADYYEVSVEYLLGRTESPTSPTVTENDLKVALFGGSGKVTDEMWEEVKNFAEFVKKKNNE